MKQYLLNLCILFVCISATLLLPNRSYGQLNGNYTINPTKSASNTNYQNWASAVGDLINGTRTDGGNAQGSGISGAVVITVYDTLYDNTNVAITAITGASYSNTITFKSAKGDSSKCRLRYASGTTTTDDYVLLLNGADYITFRQIGFERTGTNTYSTVVGITNTAVNNKFIRCLMKGRKMASSSGLGFAYGYGSCVYIQGNADSLQLTQNRLLYGYNGVYNPNTCSGITYTGNVCDTNGSSGIYTTNQTSIRIIGNTFNMGDFGAGSGHYTSYGIRIEGSPGLLISGNKISMTAVNSQVCRGLVIASNVSTASTPTMIYNNSIYNSGGGTGSCTGLAVYNSYYMNFFYNNILINNSLADGAAYFQYYSSGTTTYTNSNLNLVNNNLINKGGGYAVDVRDAVNYANIDSFDYNNIYSTGSYQAYWNATKYSSLSSFQSGSGKAANSLSLDPGYVSNSDLHVSNIAINGKALPYAKILTDIDNEVRNLTTPDIGSDEFFPVTLDAGISAIDSPVLFAAGKHNVKVRFQNYGIDTIRNIQIGWTVNGSPQTAGSWTGKLAPGGLSAAINLGPYTFAGNTAYNFRIWTRIPNGSPDQKNINDTLKTIRYAAMSGNYTIGDTNVANYKSFSQAITALTERGISGTTTFNIYNGVYNEQIGMAALPGMGASSPVIFQSISKDSTKVKISLASTVANGSNNAAIQLRGASYVTFKGITFERTGTNPFGHVVHILNGSHHNTFTNCRMLGLVLSAVNASAVNIWSDQGKDDYNVFKNNYVKNGNYNILFLGGGNGTHEKGTVIDHNVFEGGYRNAIQLAYNDSAIVRGNTFMNITVTDSNTNDLMLYDCDLDAKIIGNFFQDAVSENAIRLINCNASASLPATIANNSIIKNSGTGIQANKGISINGADYQNIAFNSIYFTGNNTTNAGIYTSTTTATNIVLKNNNIVMESGEVLHISTASQVSASNNNNLYAKGTQFAYWGTSYTSLGAMAGATGKDNLSGSVDPLFTSSTDLHIKNPVLKGAGTPVALVTTDFDGELRNTTTPDIGADEFKLVPNDAGMILVTKPTSGTCAGILDVEAVIRNFGGDTLKKATIQWSVNGLSQTPYAWTGLLPTNGRDTFIIGTFNFNGITSPRFIVKSMLPNNLVDGINFNDSVIVVRTIRALPANNLGADLSICLGDSVIIGPTNNISFTYQWTTINNTLISNSSQIYAKPKVKTSYVLQVTNISTGCSKKDTLDISLNSKPVADAGSDQTVCTGATVQLGKSPQTGFSYSWSSKPTGFTSLLANPTDKPSATTSYYLQKSITLTGCKAMDTVVITISLPPTPQVLGTTAACFNDILNYSTQLNTGHTYNWKVNGGQLLNGQNTNRINVHWDNVGTGTLEVIETDAVPCKDTTNYSVIVSPNPIADFSVSKTCIGSVTGFTDLSTSAQTYNWNFDDGGTSTLKNPNHAFATVNTYNVRLIAKNSFGCPDTTIKSVPINPLPIANFTMVSKANRTIEFSDSSKIPSGSVTGWRWDFGDGDTSLAENPTHQYVSDGNVTVSLCATSGAGCQNCITKNYNVLGIFSSTVDKSLYATPNPGSGIFKIMAGTTVQTANITNALGQLIATYQPQSNEFRIDLSQQPSGIYFIKVNSANGSNTLKIVKQ